MTQDTRDKLIEAVASVRANLESADRVAPDGAIVVVEDREALRTIINALPDEEMVARALAEADGCRDWDALCPVGFFAQPRFTGKDYWFTQARAAISTLCVGGK
jgi:hypothetical protein